MVLKAASPAKAGEQFPDDGGNNMKSDSELRHDVERELEWDPSIDARNIGSHGQKWSGDADRKCVQL